MNRQVIDVPLAQGLNQKADRRYIELGGHAQLINCRKQKNNAIIKRPGHTAITKNVSGGAGPALTACVGGGTARGVPWMSDGSTLNAYSDAAAQWVMQSKIPEVAVLDRQAVASLVANSNDRDQVSSSGFRLVIYTGLLGSNGLALFWTVLDAVTGATVVPAQQVDATLTNNVLGAKLCLCGTTAVLTYIYGSLLYGRTLNMAAPLAGWSAAGSLVSNLSGTAIGFGLYGLSAVSGDPTRFAVAYELGTAHSGNNAAISQFTAANPIAFISTVYNETAFSTLGPIVLSSVSGGYHWMFYTASSPSKKARAWGVVDGSSTPTSVVTVTSWGFSSYGPHAICAVGNAAVCFWSQGPTNTNAQAVGWMSQTFAKAQQVGDVSGTATLLGGTRFTTGINWASSPVVVNGVAYILAYLPSNLQPTYYLVACDWYGNTSWPGAFPVRVVATFAPRIASINSLGFSGLTSLPHICNDSGTLYSVPIEVLTQPGQHAIYIEQFDFGSTLRHVASGDLGEASNTAIIAGQATAYDGEIGFELGYAYYPELGGQGGPGPTGIVVSATGGNMGTGTQAGIPQIRQYVIVYEWYDAQGNVHRSAPSPPMTADMSTLSNGTSGSVELTLPCIGLTQRRVGSAALNGGPAFQQTLPTDVYIIPYRTVAGGTLFYRLPPLAATSGQVSALLSIDANATVSYTDTQPDSAAGAGASLTDGTHSLLYTTGGFLANMGPPGPRAFCTHGSRYWLGGTDDPAALWPSKQLTPGEVPGFNESLNLYASGAVRALASMDGNLVVFVQRTDGYGIEFISGQGPLDNGQQSDWTPPQRIPSDTGAVDQRAVCAFPGGVLFRGTVGGPKGAGGIFVLSRDFQVQYVGAPIEDTLAQYPVVTSMRLHPTAGRVYVECVNSDTAPSMGARIVWDYIMGVWSIDQVFDADTAGVPGARFAWVANTSTAGVATAAYYWATAGGRVYRENVGTEALANMDGSQWVTMTVQTAWIKPAISQAVRFWRVQLSGDSIDPYNFTMTLTFDYAPSSYYSETLSGRTPSFVAGEIGAFDRYPQVDVEQYVGNQLAKSIQVTLTDASPTGGASRTQPVAFATGAGPSWSTLSIEIGTDGRRYPNIPAGQRG